jgi:hypothetical protein
MAYAEGTIVSVARSQEEIQRLVRKHGARKVGTYTDDDAAVVTFQTNDRTVKFRIPMPGPKDPRVVAAAAKIHRDRESALDRALEAEERRRWRALVLVIKARLEAVAEGVETFDEAFLAHIVTPGGATILEELRRIEKTTGQRMLGPVGDA